MSDAPAASAAAVLQAAPSRFWIRFVVGFVLAWMVLQGTASALNSLRGEAGWAVAALAVLALLAVERVFFRTPPRVVRWR